MFFTTTLPCRYGHRAPEVILTKGHDKSVDYWAIGVLVYELLCGCTPFESSSQPETFKKIVQSQRYLGFPPKFDPHAKSLIRKLLHPNAGLRLGALQSGFSDIKDHPFFVTAVRGCTFQSTTIDGFLTSFTTSCYLPIFSSCAVAQLGGTRATRVVCTVHSCEQLLAADFSNLLCTCEHTNFHRCLLLSCLIVSCCCDSLVRSPSSFACSIKR